MKRIDKNFKDYIGQGENSDLFISVIEFDRNFDKYFDVDYSKAESKLVTNEEDIYPGLEDSALLTSYLDYYQIYDDLSDGENLVDLGAGYCRGSMLFNTLGGKRCLSLEIIESRVEAAKKICRDDIFVNDITSAEFIIPVESHYLIYLPVSKVLYTLFKKLIEQKIEATFYVIESHGDLVDFFKMHDSLFTLIGKPFKTSTPRHNQWVYKFKSNILTNFKIEDELFNSNIPLWHLYNFDSPKKFIIESKIMNSNKTKVWSADIKGSRIINYNNELAVYLENPARILQLKTQDKILQITP
jgi:hypothetical protein